MTSTFTPNKNIEKPAFNDYVDGWDVPVNSDFTIIDTALGGKTTFNVTGLTATPITLSIGEYQPPIIILTNTISANLTYVIPSAVGGEWIIANRTTGAFTVTFTSGGGGTSVVCTQGQNTAIFSDGTNIARSDSNTATPGGSTTQVQFNSSGAFAGSANLTFDTAGQNLTSGTFTDAKGNMRVIPANAQGGAYVLVEADVGKYINITTGGVTVPASIFSSGNAISIYNNSASDQTITQGGSVTMYLSGTATTGNRTLAQRGVATVLCVAANTFVIAGSGLS
jgi:hypothetical protein